MSNSNAASAGSYGLPKMPATPQEEGLLITEFLKGSLQIVRRAFLQVGKLLVEIREKKLYAAMGHADLDSYALERLRLGRTSLYNYLRIYDWVKAHHPEWIDAEPGIVVPDLTDVVDLIHIDGELTRTDLAPATRKGLEGLKEKAIAGQLKKSDVAAYRQRGRTQSEGLKDFLSSLRQLRKRGARMKDMPPEAIAALDSAIEIISHAKALTGLDTPAKK